MKNQMATRTVNVWRRSTNHMSKLKPVTENDVKALVKDWFDERGAWSYAPIQNGLGVHGIHDRVGCVPLVITQEMVGQIVGAFVSVEAKRPGRRGEKDQGMTPAQRDNLLAINTKHGIAIRCDSAGDLADLDIRIHRLQRGT